MNKVSDLEFDCSTWDEKDPENITGLTGIIFDGEIINDETGEMLACGEEINSFLDKELAKACDTDLNSIEECIYDLNETPEPKIKVQKKLITKGWS